MKRNNVNPEALKTWIW